MIDILEVFNIPNSCKVSKKLDKKEFNDNFSLNVNDRKVLSKDIEKITLEYILNNDTVNISSFIDEEKDYSEVAIIKVIVSNQNKLKTINKIIQEIPYPLIVIYQFENQISLCVSPKRINKSDSSKLVVEEEHFTSWINLSTQNEIESKFLNSLEINNHPFINLLSFYESYTNLIISFNASKYNGTLNISENQKEILKNIEALELKITEQKNKIKKETNFSDKVSLNIELKKLNDKLKELKGSL